MKPDNSNAIVLVVSACVDATCGFTGSVLEFQQISRMMCGPVHPAYRFASTVRVTCRCLVYSVGGLNLVTVLNTYIVSPVTPCRMSWTSRSSSGKASERCYPTSFDWHCRHVYPTSFDWHCCHVYLTSVDWHCRHVGGGTGGEPQRAQWHDILEERYCIINSLVDKSSKLLHLIQIWY
jgi:hypothetical protein